MSDYMKGDALELTDLLNLFEDDITIADIIASKLLGKVSASIVKKRIELHMTQKEFARYMNVSQGMVSRWEGGDYNFSIKTLAEIAEKLDLELAVNLNPYRNGIQIQHIQDTDVSYVVSDHKEFVGKPCKIVKYRTNTKIVKNVDECKVYCFNEKLEM